MKNKSIYKTLRLLCGFAAVFLLLSVGFFKTEAAVSSTKEPTGPSESIYAAGNPNAYPIEYYDRDSGAYRGLIPDMLGLVSEKTGLDFVYISAGAKKEQKQLSRNNQAELVTAVLSDDTECMLKEKFPVFTVETDGGKITYCIGFTETAPSELSEKIKSALSQISDEQKAGLLLYYAENNRTPDKTNRLIFAGALILGAVIATLAVVFTVLALRKRKTREKDMTDELTGLGNADYYTYFFGAFVSGKAKNLYNIAYLAFDTENAEKNCGESAVSDIQKYAAARLNGAVGAAECTARIQNGVFVFVFQAENREETDRRICETLNRLNGYLGEFDPEWSKLFAAGVCRLAEHHDCDAETSFNAAKQGYIRAVRSGEIYNVGSSEQLKIADKNKKLRSSVGKALENGNFRIYLQFIADAESSEICGAEVLSRWQNTEYGLLQPHEYIEILKETGKIVEHDYSVFSKTCRQLEKWSEPPFDKLFLSCNFTRFSVSKPDFAEKILETAAKYKFDRSRLVMEITEDSLLADSKAVSVNIQKCRKNGFKIAVDDMGTGFSSLSDIYDNDVDIVKIEHSFTSQYTSPRRYKMLRDIITLVHNTGARVICEGIETQPQRDAIAEIGCDMLQGFYYSRALPLSECESFICGRGV